ncbi:MAG TPA: hypothetical protein VEY91_04270 [Candidatus Limnocylindria bacterium]|nr:hypothetical protein [Candidatus Limnocylindria bacterium]
MARPTLGMTLLVMLTASLGHAQAVPAPEATPFAAPAVAPERPFMVSALALEGPLLAQGRSMLDPKKPKKPKRGRSMAGRPREARAGVLSPERARVLLQSLTVPGWGQATAGARRSSAAFLIAEAGVWGSFTAFRIQQQLRRESSLRTASLFAGIDLHSRDEEFRRVVGLFPSSDEYNRLVVRRDAANLYFGDPAAYNAYIAEHELQGADTWSWASAESFFRYRDQRQDGQRAGLRANTALALAVANRIVSAIHAARFARPAPTAAPPTSWNFECLPDAGDPTAFHVGIRARF